MQTNLGSNFQMCQSFLPLLKNASGASIINISSINAFQATPNKVLDRMMRPAIDSLTKSLAVEWAQYEIRVNTVAPDFANTERMRQYTKKTSFYRILTTYRLNEWQILMKSQR